MSQWDDYLADIQFSFRIQKEMAERAFTQLTDGEFFAKPHESSNSVAIIVKHLTGNLKSRWTDFLTTDGDKPWRNRDSEFVIAAEDTRQKLLANWQAAWETTFQSLANLREHDLAKTITIRGEPHTVLQAIHRGLTHAAYHAGQILYVARLVKSGDWKWITIPPGQSATARTYLK